ncbi:MAG: hypothetical protein D6686_11480 [Alphaproteobacteria bacterium]|nr:MAG: hypothetical protein D6686_11480 [Alphaproteobacteria bacterium]
MTFERYLAALGRLYASAAASGFSPDLLRDLGGVFVLAARDAQHVRVDPDSLLGMARRPQDAATAARLGWERHRRQIHVQVRKSRSARLGVWAYFAKHGTRPQAPRQAARLAQPVLRADGSEVMAWKEPILRAQERIARGLDVMGDSFGAAATVATLVASARDWERATPEEWDRALDVGALARDVGQLAGTHGDARALRRQMAEDAGAPTGADPRRGRQQPPRR